KLQDRLFRRRVEAHAALERADRRSVLDAEGAVDLHLAAVVDPRDAELQYALGFDQAVEQAVARVLRMPLQERPQAGGDFLHRLQELGLARIAALDPLEELFPGTWHGLPSWSGVARSVRRAQRRRSITACAACCVLTACPAAARSAVNTRSSSAAETAASTAVASASRPSEWRSSMAALRMVA